MSVAVLLATYNSGPYLKELLDSLFKQTYVDFICYIHDDGSTDQTLDIIRNYIAIEPKRIRLLEYPPTGSAKVNFMSMLRFVEEDYVMFCDHDDVWLNDKIEVSLRKIKEIEGEKPALVFCDMKVVDQYLNVINESFMEYTGCNPKNIKLSMLMVKNVVPGCTIIMNKKLYNIARNCSDFSRIRMHDQWCAMVAAATGIIFYLNKCVLLYRQHFDNVVGAQKNKSFFEKVSNVLSRFAEFSYLSDRKIWRDNIAFQAYELSKMNELSEENRKLCESFYNLQSKGKVARIKYYLQNNIRREKDNWWLLLWYC